MKSFTKKLMLSCTGVIFASFLVVYFLFNILVSNYIRAEAERELTGGMMDVVDLTYTFPFHTWVATDTMTFMPGIRMIAPGNMPPQQHGRFEIELSATPRLTPFVYSTRIYPPATLYFREAAEGEWPIQRIGRDMSVGQITIGNIRPINQQSFVTADVIIIDGNNEILTPRLDSLPDTQRTKVESLVDYYLLNQLRFTNGEMTRVAGVTSTYYVSTTRQTVQDNTFSILMYTDISSAMAFTGSMNRILGLLLVISGLLSLVISIAMSARFKRAIGRLCSYAETIGRGNFNEKPGVFKDTEFNQLSKSMDNMSNMLQTYENNQKQFFQNVSHELRTPLMSIQGYAEGILADIFTKEEAAGIILSEGKKMADLVGELLYVSRIDNNEEASETMFVLDAQDLLYECCERVKPIAQKSGKYVTVESPPQKISIKANEEKLERAVVNILSNAIRHANSNIKVNYYAVGDNLEIAIEDDGNGINPEDLPNIFERFFKGENGNYGLGLAISNDIVKSLGGSITAENKMAPKTGAVFTITLPQKF